MAEAPFAAAAVVAHNQWEALDSRLRGNDEVSAFAGITRPDSQVAPTPLPT